MRWLVVAAACMHDHQGQTRADRYLHNYSLSVEGRSAFRFLWNNGPSADLMWLHDYLAHHGTYVEDSLLPTACRLHTLAMDMHHANRISLTMMVNKQTSFVDTTLGMQ